MPARLRKEVEEQLQLHPSLISTSSVKSRCCKSGVSIESPEPTKEGQYRWQHGDCPFEEVTNWPVGVVDYVDEVEYDVSVSCGMQKGLSGC